MRLKKMFGIIALASLSAIAYGDDVVNNQIYNIINIGEEHGLELGDNSYSRGKQSIVTSKNGVAIGKGAVASGDNNNGETIKQKLKENEDKLREIEEKQKEVNRLSNEITLKRAKERETIEAGIRVEEIYEEYEKVKQELQQLSNYLIIADARLKELKEALTLHDLKNKGENNFALGTNSLAVEDDAYAIGTNASAIGTQAISIGKNATTIGKKSVTIGNDSLTKGSMSYSVGDTNIVYGEENLIFGNNNKIGMKTGETSNRNIVIGSNIIVQNKIDNAIVLGNFFIAGYKIKKDLKILRRLLIKIFSILFIIIIILKFLSNFFIINIIRLLSIGVYKKINKENIEVEDYVLFKIKDKEILDTILNNHYIFNSNENILKKLLE